MKCSRCGFTLSNDFDRCPYCGNFIAKSSTSPFDTKINFTDNISVKTKTLIYVILINILFAGVLVDWFLNFKYGITVLSYFVSFGSMLVIEFISKKTSPISSFEKINFFILGLLILMSGLGKIENVVDARPLVVGIMFPSYLILSNIVMLLCLFFAKGGNKKMHPFITTFAVLVNLTFSSILFAFTLVNKYSGPFSIPQEAIFPFLEEYAPASNILNYVSFGFNVLFFVNFVLIFIAFVASKVKTKYGSRTN
ncbi:MAG TPA: hypothetical protein DDW20_04380 [Firmicutes bacterium]|nr:hypothetical protein [Bacillota bacterium]